MFDVVLVLNPLKLEMEVSVVLRSSERVSLGQYHSSSRRPKIPMYEKCIVLEDNDGLPISGLLEEVSTSLLTDSTCKSLFI